MVQAISRLESLSNTVWRADLLGRPVIRNNNRAQKWTKILENYYSDPICGGAPRTLQGNC